MTSLINEDYMRETFPIHKDVKDKRVTPFLAVASRRLQKWVGVINYADLNLKSELQLAEGSLTMHFLMLSLNTPIRSDGVVKSERVEGDVTIQYASPSETQNFAQMYLDQADEIVREILGNGDPQPGIGVIS